ncbi:MAG: 4-phytase [Phototrophicales bacterium]|nr:MAG: 4-phytase [Phototrophicales bacterium]
MFRKHNKKIIEHSARGVSRRNFLRWSGLAIASSALPLPPLSSKTIWNEPSRQNQRRQLRNLLRVGWQAPVTLDPANLSSDSEVALVNAIYDYLVDTNAQSQIVPRLAESWNISEDGTVYTLSLVQNATFHDGSPFTAKDVVFTFERLRDPEQSNAADFFSNISSVEAADDYTVIFTLSASSPDFLYNLSDNRAVIVKDGTTDPTDFNGTGPFRMVSFDAEDRAVMVRNENYWLADAPTVEQLEFIYFTGDNSANASANALRDGAVDVILRMPTRLFESLRNDFGTIEIPTNGYNLVRLRRDRGPGTDPNVWKAFKYATDNRLLWELIGVGLGAEGKDHPIGPLYSDYYDPTLEALGPDIDEAKRLLTEAGYPDGLDLVLHVPNSGDRPDLAEAFRSSWSLAGINVEIRLRDEGIYYSDAEDNWLEVDLGLTGWGSRPTPQQYLDLQLKTGAVWNESRFSSEELDALIELAGSSLDRETRIQAYKDIQAYLIENGPIIVPYFFPQFAAFANDVDGIRLHPFAGRTDFRFVTNVE